MTEKEVAELRRRFRADKSNITHVRGCYVNGSREIVSEFNQSIAMMGQEEGEMLLATLRKTLSGALGRNLMDIEFSTRQVVDSEEHKLLMALRNSRLEDTNALHAFYQKAIQALNMEDNYLILMVYDAYDVPYRSKDGEKQEDASSDVFQYILCSICPVKLTKAALSYFANESCFGHLNPGWAISPPETGFLFPAFDDRSTNLYNALYYTKDAGCNQLPFADAIFHTEPIIPATVQMESFQSILGDTLADECSYEVVQAVHDRFCEMIEEHKAAKIEETLTVSQGTVKQILKSSGVGEEHVQAFGERYDSVFGENASLPPRNLLNTKQMEIKLSDDVTIRVNSDRTDLVETRVMNGARYILIRAEGDVEVNGVQIKIRSKELL
ncbi:MAG: DUF4317 domain-containing protein [Oscillospiraceae bacterium]